MARYIKERQPAPVGGGQAFCGNSRRFPDDRWDDYRTFDNLKEH